VPNLTRKYLFTDKNRLEDKWPYDSTYGTLYHTNDPLIILVQTCHLDLVVPPDVPPHNFLDLARNMFETETLDLISNNIIDTTTHDAKSPQQISPLLAMEDYHNGNEDNDVRSREKADMFHQLFNVPLKRRSPSRPYIMAIFVSATFF
jgi:hypothetical protein